MKEIKENRCLVCGNEMEQPLHGRRRKYCSAKCRSIYGNKKNTVKPVLPAGLTKCKQCGKKYERPENSKGECCSLMCAQAWGQRYKIEEIRRLAKEEKRGENPRPLQDWVLELHYNGYERRAIMGALGLPEHKLKSWIRRSERGSDGNWIKKPDRKRHRIGEPYFRQFHYDYPEARTSAEWLRTLHECMIEKHPCRGDSVPESRPIFLVCGVTTMRKSADSLCSIIQYELRMNPFEGDVFAFCGKNGTQIRYMYWDGSGFNVVLRTRERGTYPWPAPKLGAAMPVTSADFECILRGERAFSKCASRPISWDCIDLPSFV